MGFYVVLDKGFPRNIIPEDEYAAYPYLKDQYQIIDSGQQKPDGRQLVIHVPFGTGHEKIKVSTNHEVSKIVIAVKSNDAVFGLVVSVGQRGQSIKVIPLTGLRLVKNDLFKSLLIGIISNPSSDLGNRPKKMAIDCLVDIIKSGSHSFSFTDGNGRLVKAFMNYDNNCLSLRTPNEKKHIRFSSLHSIKI